MLSNFSFIINSLICFAILFVILFVLWELGIIAGADLKIFLVISIFNPLNLVFLSENAVVFTKVLFPLTLLVLSLLLLVPYIFTYGLVYIFIKKPKLLLEKLINIKSFLSLLCSTVLIYLVNLFFNIFFKGFNIWIVVVLSIFIYYFFFKIKKYFSDFLLLTFSFVFLITIILNYLLLPFFVFDLNEFLMIFLFLIIINILTKLYYLIKNNALVTTKLIYNLNEGDLLYYNYYKKGSNIYFEKISFFKQIKLLLKNKYSENLKIDSKKACGLNASDIRFLKTMYESNLISKYILIRKTIPYVPAILIAYILLNILGDFIWLIF
jgi:preflagellin peptidase FlaK